jgi:ATP synthase protein I
MSRNDDRRERADRFGDIIQKKAERRLKARREKDRSLWFGLGMFGVIGWSIAIPMLLCIAIGRWLDRKTASPFSWTLVFLCIGLIIGCINAWFWIKKGRDGNDHDR